MVRGLGRDAGTRRPRAPACRVPAPLPQHPSVEHRGARGSGRRRVRVRRRVRTARPLPTSRHRCRRRRLHVRARLLRHARALARVEHGCDDSARRARHTHRGTLRCAAGRARRHRPLVRLRLRLPDDVVDKELLRHQRVRSTRAQGLH